MRLRRFILVLIAAAFAAGLWRETPSRFTPAKRKPAAAQTWERLDGCQLVPGEWNDSDSFRVRHGGRVHLFRLYFVDAPETVSSFPKRVAEQAAYFRVTPARSLEIGKEASAFTRKQLQGRSFTVWTRWSDALGSGRQQRFYAIVKLESRDLGEQLVAAGLARIYGKRTPLPDGRDSRQYRARLRQLEAAAKAQRKGGWR